MIDLKIKREVILKMTEARKQILIDYPFYGYLAMNLMLGTEPCGTAYTDMRRIVFDPDFALRLSMEEMKFVFLHEVLHCVLNHCTRGKGYDGKLFNIACDIVVNSNILFSMGIDKFLIDGEEVMHLAPNKKEGREYQAEEVYEMLLKKFDSIAGNIGAMDGLRSKTDDHEIWKSIGADAVESDQWKTRAKNAGKLPSAKNGLPPAVREYARLLNREGKVDWREVLRQFTQTYCDKYDYLFHPGDRRFTEYDYVVPAFSAEEEERVENIWFCVDTSASVSEKELAVIMDEIYQCIEQLPGFRGKLSYFDTTVSEPQDFEDEESLLACTPVGGGGTSFAAVFRYMKHHMAEKMPAAIVMLTDGYDTFPLESAAMDVPVLWLIINSYVEAPWGTCVHVEW